MDDESATAKLVPDLIIHSNGWKNYLARRLFPNSRAIELSEVAKWSGKAAINRALRRPAPIILCHLNHSLCTPYLERLAFLAPMLEEKGGALWNYNVRDIRKRSLQQFLRAAGMPNVEVGSDYDGLVIVKTNNNARGDPDARAMGDTVDPLQALMMYQRPGAARTDYVVMDAKKVPADLWFRDDIAIERFYEHGSDSIVRTFISGRRLLLSVATAAGPVRRWEMSTSRGDLLLNDSLIDWTDLDGALGEIASKAFRQMVAFCEAFGLDFGAVDQILDDRGTPYIVDVNLTPHWRGTVLQSMRGHLGERRRIAFGPLRAMPKVLQFYPRPSN